MNLIERLTYENQVLKQDGMSQFQIYGNPSDGYYLYGDHRTNADSSYGLWSPIPAGFPTARPCVYVHTPNPLWAFRRAQTINGLGVSHRMHTLSNGPNGEVQICHWRDDRWHSGITFNRVMIKAMLWLEAYEQHFSTGRGIDEFVRSMS